ncbi:MAG: hypothetical protein IIZ13_08265 [Renibacterium sp.]|nr:hypothetical protein [Renibacterium sp.]
MGFHLALLAGIGEYLDTLAIGKWNPTQPFAPADTAITLDDLPTSPDRAVSLNLYPVQDDGTTDSVVGLQFRIRGAPNDKRSDKTILDGLFDALHDLKNTELGGIPIVRIWHQSGANLGPDEKLRQEHTANYYIQLTREGTHRTDD